MSSQNSAVEAAGHRQRSGGQRRASQPMDAERTKSAWLANMRQEVMAPISAVIELAEIVLSDAQERGHEEFLADLQKIHTAGQQFLTLVQETLDPTRSHLDDSDFSKKIRHDLRTPLNHIIGYCELWLDDAGNLLLEAFVPDLQKMHALGKQTLARLDDVVKLVQPASTGEPAPIADWIRDTVLSSARDAEERTTLAAEKGTLLVVDDNEINRDVLCRWLRREGHQVATAQNGLEALALLRAQPFDLVLLDMLMPEMNGFQVLQHMKADDNLRHVPVIMISAFDEIDCVVNCIEYGAEDYLPKPFNPVLLKARLGACLEKKLLRDREVHYLKEIQKERQRSDELLHVILPTEVVAELKATNTVKPRRYENVAVSFCDIVGFTPFCDRNQPEQVVAYLQQLIEAWEEIALRHGVSKIKTIGDAFMAAAGLLHATDNPVLACVRCGLEMIAATRSLTAGWNIRVGIHAGPVIAGVIGRRQYLFDLWGDTVNTAARMESHGVPGAITLSSDAWQHIAHLSRGTSLGLVPIKGKGSLEMIRFDEFIT